MSENVTFGIKINVDDKGVGQATINVKELAQAVGDFKNNMPPTPPFDDWKTSIVALEALTSALSRISGAVHELTDLYAAQEVAEAKLSQVMQNTMGATEADTQAILDLCSAQQKLGVIGDEVQLAGAQELATYLTERSTLESLIPVMNDMVAQQYGVNASQESAAQIATMLGKVMDGQVGALSRYGYKFDEAQEVILKFGTEEERAAVLAEVVGAAVGGVNQALAQTSSGKMQQLANAVGDVKEQMGKLLVNVEPAINGLIGMGQTVISIKEIAPVIMNIGSALGGLIGKIATATGAWIKNTASMVANKASLIAHAAAQGVVKAATVAWTAVQKVLNLVLSANPIGLIITAIGALVAAIITAYRNSESFRNVCDKVFAVIKTVANVIWDLLVAAFNQLTKPIRDTIQFFGDLYDSCGWFRTACDAVWNGLKKLASMIKDQVVKQIETLTGAIKKAWNWLKKFFGIGNKESEETADALEGEANAANETADAYKNLDKYKQMAAASKGGNNPPKPPKNGNNKAAPKGSIAAIDAAIQEKQAIYKTAVEAASRAAVQKELDDLEAQKRLIEFEVQLQMNGIGSIREALDFGEKMKPIEIGVIGESTLKAANIALKDVNASENKLGNTTKKVARDGKKFNETMNASGQLLGNLSDLTRVATKDEHNHAAAYMEWGAAVVQSVGQAISAIMALIPVKAEEEQQSKKNTTANVAEAASGLFSGFSEIPIVGIILALAAVAGMVATMLRLPKFAKGGIAFGPTIGMFGEYAGAANNPEVVAPLSRLKSLLGDSGNGGGEVEFRIKGRRLVGVLAKEGNVMARR